MHPTHGDNEEKVGEDEDTCYTRRQMMMGEVLEMQSVNRDGGDEDKNKHGQVALFNLIW